MCISEPDVQLLKFCIKLYNILHWLISLPPITHLFHTYSSWATKLPTSSLLAFCRKSARYQSTCGLAAISLSFDFTLVWLTKKHTLSQFFPFEINPHEMGYTSPKSVLHTGKKSLQCGGCEKLQIHFSLMGPCIHF